MSLVQLIVVLAVVGVLLWAINAYVPMDRKIKGILNVVVVIAVVLWLLGLLGGSGLPRLSQGTPWYHGGYVVGDAGG